MAASFAGRSAFRSSSLLGATSRAAASAARSASGPRLRLPIPAAAPRILRTPVEMSFCVESLMPMHSATASALMRSLLSVPGRGYGCLLEGNDETR